MAKPAAPRGRTAPPPPAKPVKRAPPAPPTAKATKPRGGRPEHSPTDATRRTVRVGAAHKIPHKTLADQIGINEATLRKHYRQELDDAVPVLRHLVGMSVVRQALRGNVNAARYWLMCHGGPEWRPTSGMHHSGNAGFSGSDEELDARIAELQRAQSAATAGRARMARLPD